MKNLFKRYLESTHELKIFVSLVVLAFVMAVNFVFYLSKIWFCNKTFSLAFFLWVLGAIVSVFSFIIITSHAIYWKGFDLPFPIAKPHETINGKWKHHLGHEYYFGLFPMLIFSYVAGSWQLCFVLLAGFAIGMRRSWNYNEMWKKIN